MKTPQTKSYIKWTFLLSLACTASGGLAASKGGAKSSGGDHPVFGFEVGRHTDTQIWVQGKKESTTYSFSGSSWLLFATRPPNKAGEKNVVPPTIALWGDVLVNNYTTKDPSGTAVKEVVKTQGLGLGLIERDATTGFGYAFIGGVERAFISQTGDTPRSQRYPYGIGVRAGLGWSPFKPDWSPYLRVDYIFKHFPSATWNGQALKPIEVQSYVPCLGFSISF